MDSESNLDAEPRDRTKLIWLGVVATAVIMVGLLWVTQKPSENVSMVHARHILVGANMNDPADRQRALERAKDLRQQILNGASFSKLAKEYSNDPFSSARGGDLGWATRDYYEDNFEDYVWHAPEHRIGEIIKGSKGFHLIEVMERRLSAADKYERALQEKTKQGIETGTDGSPAASPAPDSSTTPAKP